MEENRGGADFPPTVRSAARAFGAALAPPTAVTALAVYFAVRRQEALALYFGIDTSVLGYSTQDYLLRAGDTLFVALLFLLVAGLALLWAHAAALRRLENRPSDQALRWLGLLLTAFGAALFGFGVVAVFQPMPLPIYVRTLSLGVGAGAFAYGVYLQRRLRSHSSSEPAWLTTASVVLVAVLVFLSLFWSTKELAQALGRGQAQVLEATLSTRPGVVIYSEQRLLIEGPGVAEQVLDQANEAYRFRYTGLRLLVHSADHYFLLPAGWTRSDGRAIVLPSDEEMRVEYTPGGR